MVDRKENIHSICTMKHLFILLLIRGCLLSLLSFEDTYNNLLFLNQEGPDYPVKGQILSLVSSNRVR